MKKIYAFSILVITGIAVLSFYGSLNSGGKAGSTGSPGEGTCGACHSGGSSSVSGASITATPQFTNNQYIPGQTYTVNVIALAVGFNAYGFGCEILNAANNNNIGTMQNPGAGVQLLNAPNGRTNATQTAPKTGMPVIFSFEWVAPSSGTANIYACVNAVNGNGGTSGDFVMTTSLSLSPSNTSGIKDLTNNGIELNIYPVPFNNELNINMRSEKSLSDVKALIYDFHGKKVFESESFNLSVGENKMKFDLAELEGNIFTLKLESKNQLVDSRLIFRQD
jgi:hypothetical protein